VFCLQTFVFTGKNCPACKLLIADLQRLGIEFEAIDVEDYVRYPEVCRRFGFYPMSLPTLLVVENDKVIGSIIGYPGRQNLESELAEVMA